MFLDKSYSVDFTTDYRIVISKRDPKTWKGVDHHPSANRTPERHKEEAVYVSGKKSGSKPAEQSGSKKQHSQPSAQKPKSSSKSRLEDSDYIKNNVFDVNELADAAEDSDPDRRPQGMPLSSRQPNKPSVKPRDFQYKEDLKRDYDVRSKSINR